MFPSLHLQALKKAYEAGELAPASLAERLAERLAAEGHEGIWIDRLSAGEIVSQARAVEARRRAGEALPLYGVPFAVKDNIDVEGRTTTAGCPAFGYRAARTATAVSRLLEAGAILVGKTNLDQFATGLVGVRSPYGVPRNPFDDRYIVGGSSSGSAAAVARGLVGFALGTDTAGSGRVPAAFTNIVGLKPSPGLVSTAGVVPACRSLDCVSVFALTVEDAREVAALAAAYDPAGPYGREAPAPGAFARRARPARFRFGVPPPGDLELFGDGAAAALFARAVERLEALGGERVAIDYAPFREAAALLYQGPWIAERLCELERFIAASPGALLPVTLEILRGGARFSATEAFAAAHRIEELRRATAPVWRDVAALALPTAPTIYRVEEVEREPLALNTRLGTYTNFVNLLDLAALAVPAGFRPDGLPFGITLVGPHGSDGLLAALGGAFHAAGGGPMGATGVPLPADEPGPSAAARDRIPLAVVGAHLSGMPLNGQLVELGGRLLRACRTAPVYRLYSLPDATPPKPGLVRVASGGAPIEVEVWSLPAEAFGAFFANVRAPLSLGTVALEDGEAVPGFLCEAYAVAGALDITSHGGWRAFRAGR
jgi:allophanate hydrolase